MNYNERFFLVFEAIKKQGLIATYVELAAILETNKAGINDIKSGKKKLTIENIENMKLSYPMINCDYIIMGTGSMFDLERDNNDVKDHFISIIESQQRTIENLSNFISKKENIAEGA